MVLAIDLPGDSAQILQGHSQPGLGGRAEHGEGQRQRAKRGRMGVFCGRRVSHRPATQCVPWAAARLRSLRGQTTEVLERIEN